MSRFKGRRAWALSAAFALIAVGACGGDDDDPVAGTDGDPTETADDTADPAAPDSDDDGDSGGGGGAPMGTATVDGTEYTLVADLQCLVALDEANQISISGRVEENEGDDQVEFSYAWDSDDDVNEFTIDLSDDLEYTTFDGQAEFGEPQVDGDTVTASGALIPMIGEVVDDASFEIDCAG